MGRLKDSGGFITVIPRDHGKVNVCHVRAIADADSLKDANERLARCRRPALAYRGLPRKEHRE